MVQTAEMLLEVAEWIGRELKISFENFVNIGGGLGIPYRPEDTPLALEDMSTASGQAFAACQSTQRLWSETLHGEQPKHFPHVFGVFNKNLNRRRRFG